MRSYPLPRAANSLLPRRSSRRSGLRQTAVTMISRASVPSTQQPTSYAVMRREIRGEGDPSSAAARRRLVAGRLFDAAKRSGEAGFCAARPQGNRLTFMRRPGGQGDDLETRWNSAIRTGELLRIEGGGAQQR